MLRLLKLLADCLSFGGRPGRPVADLGGGSLRLGYLRPSGSQCVDSIGVHHREVQKTLDSAWWLVLLSTRS